MSIPSGPTRRAWWQTGYRDGYQAAMREALEMLNGRGEAGMIEYVRANASPQSAASRDIPT